MDLVDSDSDVEEVRRPRITRRRTEYNEPAVEDDSESHQGEEQAPRPGAKIRQLPEKSAACDDDGKSQSEPEDEDGASQDVADKPLVGDHQLPLLEKGDSHDKTARVKSRETKTRCPKMR